VVTLLVAFVASPSSADTEDELRRARAAVADAQARADEATAKYEAAVAREGELVAEVNAATNELEQTRQRMDELQHLLSDWAVRAYVGSGNATTEFTMSGANDVLDIGRRTRRPAARDRTTRASASGGRTGPRRHAATECRGHA
jgi:hypothetical protein